MLSELDYMCHVKWKGTFEQAQNVRAHQPAHAQSLTRAFAVHEYIH